MRFKRATVASVVLVAALTGATPALASHSPTPPDTAPPTQFTPACQSGQNFGQQTRGGFLTPGETPGKISHGAAGHCLGLFPVG